MLHLVKANICLYSRGRAILCCKSRDKLLMRWDLRRRDRLLDCRQVSPELQQLIGVLTNLQRCIAADLFMMMNLALSNPESTNAFYLPAHMLSLCTKLPLCCAKHLYMLTKLAGGYCIKRGSQRRQTIYFLETVQRTIRWKTRKLIQSLQRQWEELDN